jgi:RimJ/RimL family protein N-acetyltransferase
MDELRWPASPPTLTGELVVLRPWRPDDAESVFAACQDPDIQRWTMVPVPYLRDHASSFVAEVAPSDWSSRRGAPFAVVGNDGRLLGSCGVVRVDAPHRLGEIGYWVAPWARTKGVASGAVRLATSWAMDELGLARLELHIEPENVASCAVAERAGYVREALLRSKILHRGARRDIVIYSALR